MSLLGKDQPFDPRKDAPRKAVIPTPLDAAARQVTLDRRIGVGMLSAGGSFNSYASFLFAGPGLVVHTDDPEIGAVRLRNSFPRGYRPTVRELFDHIAAQTSASWSYDETRAYWVFARPAAPLPFRVALAKDWSSEPRDGYLGCQPPIAPVGMDVYLVHTFSVPAEETVPFECRSREEAAVEFAQPFRPSVSAHDMTLVQIGRHEALFFTCPTPRPGATWRQWSIAERGHQIVVVSVIEAQNEAALLPQVEAMVASLEIGATNAQ